MKLIVDAWTHWVLVLTFDFWRYPDSVRQRETPATGGAGEG